MILALMLEGRTFTVSASVKDYQMPAPSENAIRKALLVGRHLMILNSSGP